MSKFDELSKEFWMKPPRERTLAAWRAIVEYVRELEKKEKKNIVRIK